MTVYLVVRWLPDSIEFDRCYADEADATLRIGYLNHARKRGLWEIMPIDVERPGMARDVAIGKARIGTTNG